MNQYILLGAIVGCVSCFFIGADYGKSKRDSDALKDLGSDVCA